MMRFSFSSPLESATLTRSRTAPCHPCLLCFLVFLCFALSELAAQELRVVVVDASAKQVAVPVWVFDATGKLLQETSSKHSGEAPLALIPGTYTVAITENERQQVRLGSGESLRLVLDRSTLAIPLNRVSHSACPGPPCRGYCSSAAPNPPYRPRSGPGA